jgi:hypothetical protein
MFVKTVYGEVKSNDFAGQDVQYKECCSIEECRSQLHLILKLDHDESEWLNVPSHIAAVQSLEVDSVITVNSTEFIDGDQYSCYEYSIVTDKD